MKRSVWTILAGILLILLLCGQLQAQSRIYYHSYDGWIHWTTYDTGTVASFELPWAWPVSTAVDQDDGWLYWITTGSLGHGYYGSLYRSRLHDWTNFERVMETGYTQGGLEIDVKHSMAYWPAPVVAEPVGEKYFSIVRAPLNGSEWEVWLPSVSEDASGMDSDVNSRLIFWTGGDALMRAHFDKDIAEVVELDWDAAGLTEPPRYKGGVALDTMYRKVYWSYGANPWANQTGNNAQIYRAQYMGGTPTLIYEATDASIPEVEFDPVARVLYWVEVGVEGGKTASARRVMRAPVGGPLPLVGTEVFGGPIQLTLFVDPGPAELIAPGSESEVETSVELDWDEVLGSPRYDVVVASDPDLTHVVYKENLPQTHAEFVAPVAGRTYYWRVQSNACYIAPHWSETRTLTVGHTGPLAATLTHPAADEKIEPSDTFTWTAASEAATYTMEISSRPDFAEVLVGGTNLTSTNMDVEGLERGQTYYWRVAGLDASGRYTYTAPVAFSVVELLSAVSLTFPDDGSVGIAPYANLQWLLFDGAGPVTYDLEVARDAAFTDLVTTASSLTVGEYTFEAPLAYETTYYWRVRGVNESGPGEWSDVWSFVTAVGTSAEANPEIPDETRLLAAYPNPVSRKLTVPVELAEAVAARIEVFDVAGRCVNVIESPRSGPGRFDIQIDTGEWRSGTYLLVLQGTQSRPVPVVVIH